MNQSLSLYRLTDQYRELERLADDDIPEEVIRDTLEALTGEIEVKATNVAKFAGNLAMLRDAVDEAAKAMKERAARINRKVDALHHYILNNMKACGITKIESPEFTLSVQKNPPAVVIDDEGSIPDEYMVTPPPAPPPVARPDKKAITDAIKGGATVDGAHLEYGYRLKVKI